MPHVNLGALSREPLKNGLMSDRAAHTCQNGGSGRSSFQPTVPPSGSGVGPPALSTGPRSKIAERARAEQSAVGVDHVRAVRVGCAGVRPIYRRS